MPIDEALEEQEMSKNEKAEKRLSGSSKIQKLLQLVAQEINENKVVIVSQWRELLCLFGQELKKVKKKT